MNEKIKQLILNHPCLMEKVLMITNFVLPGNRLFCPSDNKLQYRVVLFRRTKLYIRGIGNIIKIGDYSRLMDCEIYIRGDYNTVNIGDRCYLQSASFYIEDNHNTIEIGEHTSVDGKTQFATIEGTSINLGKDCMLSTDINIRTGDAHSILDMDGHRINASKNVMIGDHCWIGMRTIILKGVSIGNNSIIGAGTVVSKGDWEDNVVLAGAPVRIIKRNISWSRDRKQIH